MPLVLNQPHYKDLKADSTAIHQADTAATATPAVAAVPAYVRVRHRWLDPRLPYPPEYFADMPPVLSTSLVDSIAADTVVPHILTEEQAEVLRFKAMVDSIEEAQAYAEAHTGHAEGLRPEALAPSFGNMGTLGALLAGTMAVAALSSGGIRRALKAYRHELWSVRRRANVFDDARSAPSWAAVILALLFIVFGGIVLYCSTPESTAPTFLGAAAAIGVLGAYYVFQLCAYATVGYAFSTPSGRSMWLSGFAASQAFTGLALAVPALLLMYVPEWKIPLLYACAAIYCAGRLVFIGKGIRIFYNKIRSLLYFILYLCTLEIIPLFAVYAILAYIESALV